MLLSLFVYRARAEFETKIRSLETLLINKGTSSSEIEAYLAQTTGSSGNLSNSSAVSSAESELEIAKLNEKLSESTRLLAVLQSQLDEYGDLEDSKANFEEYEHNVRQELEEEQQKFEDEKQTLQNDALSC